MFRNMRRSGQQLSAEETIDILERNTSGVLAVVGDEGYPYAVPLSYVYINNNIYFHSATQGHKLDGIQSNSHVSFCVIDQDKVMPQEYTTYYKSAIAFGTARIVEDEGEKRKLIELLSEKYSPGDIEGRNHEIESTWKRFCIIHLAVEHITGKAAKEIVIAQKKAQ